jgi:hypothetical protein
MKPKTITFDADHHITAQCSIFDSQYYDKKEYFLAIDLLLCIEDLGKFNLISVSKSFNTSYVSLKMLRLYF